MALRVAVTGPSASEVINALAGEFAVPSNLPPHSCFELHHHPDPNLVIAYYDGNKQLRFMERRDIVLPEGKRLPQSKALKEVLHALAQELCCLQEFTVVQIGFPFPPLVDLGRPLVWTTEPSSPMADAALIITAQPDETQLGKVHIGIGQDIAFTIQPANALLAQVAGLTSDSLTEFTKAKEDYIIPCLTTAAGFMTPRPAEVPPLNLEGLPSRPITPAFSDDSFVRVPSADSILEMSTPTGSLRRSSSFSNVSSWSPLSPLPEGLHVCNPYMVRNPWAAPYFVMNCFHPTENNWTPPVRDWAPPAPHVKTPEKYVPAAVKEQYQPPSHAWQPTSPEFTPHQATDWKPHEDWKPLQPSWSGPSTTWSTNKPAYTAPDTWVPPSVRPHEH